MPKYSEINSDMTDLILENYAKDELQLKKKFVTKNLLLTYKYKKSKIIGSKS